MGRWMLFLALGVMVLMLQPVMAQDEAVDVEEVLDIVNGKVASVDLTANKLAITDLDGAAQEFTLDPNLTTVWDDVADEEKELGDLAVGKDVVVEFRVDENGKKVASWIDLVAVEEEKPAVTEPSAPAAEAPAVPEIEAPAVPEIEAPEAEAPA